MLKIFEIELEDGNKEYIKASTLVEAIIIYLDLMEIELEDIIESEIKEIPEEEWSGYLIDDNMSFKDYMENNDEELTIFATTYGIS
jgi:hypothetical protein